MVSPSGGTISFPGSEPQREARREDLPPLENVYFRQLFENSPEAIVLLSNDDRVIDCNRAFEKLFGYSADEARGHAINSLIVPEGSMRQASALSHKVLGGEVVAAELVRRRKDRSPIWVRILGYPILEGERQIGIFGIYSDITARRRVEKRMRLQSAAINSAANAVFITSWDGEIEWVNRAFCLLSGYPREEALGNTPHFLDPRDEEACFDLDRLRALPPGGSLRAQVIQRNKLGHSYTVDQTVTRMLERPGERTHFVVVQEDISARLEAEERLRHLAGHDYLTDLPNRYNFHEHLKLELERSSRSGHPLAVMLLDVDDFKDVNDAFGHAVGDDLLVAVARRLAGTLRAQSTLSRFGGDEFAVMQTDLRDVQNAAGLARRLIAAFDDPFTLGGKQLRVSASIGIAVFPPGRPDAKHLIKNADLALYQAKRMGRGSYKFFAEQMDQDVRYRMKLGQELHEALARRELFLEYQPQVRMPERSILAAEALLRWSHPEQGVVYPGDFVPVAEASGLIVPIGDWVLRTACAQARTWSEQIGRPLPVAVNLSPVQFKNPRLVDSIVSILEETGLRPRLLELEITESVLMQETEAAERALSELQELGVRFSLDDFGKGYSSLEYLRQFKLDKLKIDRSFVAGVAEDPHSAAIVSTVALLGSKLGLQVVAEGVETRSHVEFLLDEGCDKLQGYYFCRPVAAESLGRLLARGRGRLP